MDVLIFRSKESRGIKSRNELICYSVSMCHYDQVEIAHGTHVWVGGRLAYGVGKALAGLHMLRICKFNNKACVSCLWFATSRGHVRATYRPDVADPIYTQYYVEMIRSGAVEFCCAIFPSLTA